MYSSVFEKIEEIISLCQKHHVVKLEVFGSALRDDFNMEKSDIDFLVELEDLTPVQYGDSFFALEEGLKIIFNRKVDLLETGQIKNPYLLASINQSRQTLYAA